jgi:hypothetical protein
MLQTPTLQICVKLSEFVPLDFSWYWCYIYCPSVLWFLSRYYTVLLSFHLLTWNTFFTTLMIFWIVSLGLLFSSNWWFHCNQLSSSSTWSTSAFFFFMRWIMFVLLNMCLLLDCYIYYSFCYFVKCNSAFGTNCTTLLYSANKICRPWLNMS